MRLDRRLAEMRMAASRTRAVALIEEGRVLVNGQTARKPSQEIGEDARIDVLPSPRREYVSRAGHKLAGALAAFPDVVVAGRRCLDAGASTGGFTQVLLEAGAERVVAVDVGHGQLDARLEADPRVRSIEGLNVRNLTPEQIGGPVDLTVGDLSFISLTLVIEPLTRATVPGGEMILMVKPQFEVGRSKLGKGGVVRSEEDRSAAILRVREAAQAAGLEVLGAQDSPLAGQGGNLEHFLRLRRRESPLPAETAKP